MADYHSLKKCEFCGESIPLEAGRCPYCGSILEVTFNDSIRANPYHDTDNVANDAQTDQAAEAQTDSINEKGADQENTDAQEAGELQDNADHSTDTTPQQDSWQPQPYRPVNGWQPQPYRPVTGGSGPMNDRSSLSNGMKVFLTILFTIIPGIGQIAGIITAIVFMNSTDEDRRSFGVAILVASLIFFTLSCICCFVLAISASRAISPMY